MGTRAASDGPLPLSYQRRASPLHAARPSAAGAFCAALALAALTLSDPIPLAALACAAAGGGAAAGVWPALRRAARFGLALAVTIALINALVTRNGLTVIWRFGELPLLGEVNVTLEATVYGAILGLRALDLILVAALYTATVDPDRVLATLRRLSLRSALTAAIATRMVPLLARDARALALAQRCRPGRPPSRLALMRASTAGLLDRALEVAAALEVRGYAASRRPPRRAAARSRHDLHFAAAAVVIAALALAAPLAHLAPLRAYPTLRMAAGRSALALAGGLLLAALAPFSDRRGIA
jgi:energy-coupling factor transport system permease protein